MPKFKVDTASLHDPVEIEIDGQTYVARRLTGKTLKDVDALDQRVKGGDMSAMYDRLAYFLPDAKPKVIEALEVTDVANITMFIIENIFKAKGEEKNVPKPGGDKSR